MFDVDLDDTTYDIKMDLNNGNLAITNNTLSNELSIALLTDALDDNYTNGLKQGGFINHNLGNNIWLLTFQNTWTPQVRAEIKEQVRVSLIDYGSIEFSIINKETTQLSLKLNNGITINRSFEL